jgi:hypothetical protein
VQWPFPIDWNAQDWRAVLQNVVASVLLIFAGDVLARTLFNYIGGTRPKLRLDPGPPQPLVDLDWPFVRVTNEGLPLSPRTRAAERVIAKGTIDGTPVRLNWSSSAARPPESVDIYGGEWQDLPLVVRANQSVNASVYGWAILAQTAYLTDVTFLTQGPRNGAVAQMPLNNGRHALSITVTSLQGSEKTTEFLVTVPPWPGRIVIHQNP